MLIEDRGDVRIYCLDERVPHALIDDVEDLGGLQAKRRYGEPMSTELEVIWLFGSGWPEAEPLILMLIAAHTSTSVADPTYRRF